MTLTFFKVLQKINPGIFAVGEKYCNGLYDAVDYGGQPDISCFKLAKIAIFSPFPANNSWPLPEAAVVIWAAE